MNYGDIVRAIGEACCKRHGVEDHHKFAVTSMGKIIFPWSLKMADEMNLSPKFLVPVLMYRLTLVPPADGYGRVFYLYGENADEVLHIDVPEVSLDAFNPIPIPQEAVTALCELAGRDNPNIEIINDGNRLYTNSGLAIALTYYEQYIQPVRDGYQRVFYYTRKLSFPHPYVFTHVDTEIPA